MGESSSINKKTSECKDDCKGEKFVIDRKPDLKNLDCISPVCKRQKRRRNRNLSVQKFGTNTIQKSLNKGQKTKRLDPFRKHINKVNFVKDKKSKTKETSDAKHKLREIVVDGSNVAMAYDSICFYVTFILYYTYIFKVLSKVPYGRDIFSCVVIS